jgi:hypothetical protein
LSRITFAVLVSAALVAGSVAFTAPLARADTPDAYEILAKHYDARGGLDRLKAVEMTHIKGTLELAGLSGTVESWEGRLPYRTRAEVDLKVFSQTTGDNGTVAWEMDGNGKVRIEQDPDALARRDVARRFAEFEQLDPDSEVFTVTLEGNEDVDGRDCYVVKIASEPDATERLWYIDAEDFMLRTSVDKQPDVERRVVHSDFRNINGIVYDFRQDIEVLPVGQKQTLVVTEIDTNADVDPTMFDPPTGHAQDFRFTGGAPYAEVPFDFIERHLFLPVTIGDDTRLWVLDSGASASVIDLEYAKALGLDLSGQMKGQGAGNTVEVSFATLPAFSIDGIEFNKQQVAVIDITDLFRKTSDLDIGGILGYDFLSRFTTRVDYADSLLTFYDPGSFHYDGDGVVLDAPLKGNLFAVEATVDGVYGGRWMVDLGAGGLTFHGPYAAEHDLGTREGIDGVGFGAGGRIMHHASRYKTIELGGYTVDRPVISTAKHASEAGAFASTETTGNLGNSLLRHFVLYLDYANQRVIVEKGRDFGEIFPFDRSGLQIWRPERDVEVLFVSPGTPAAEAGFEEGDVILTIDGRDVADYGTLIDLKRMLRADVGTTYVFGIERDGERKDLNLTLRELL